jgi:hypothetical protein
LRTVCFALAILLVCSREAAGQSFTQRGFVDGRTYLYPQEAPNDDTQAVLDVLAREEAFFKPAPWIQFAGGLDLRANSHDQVEDSWRLDFTDRTVQRPRLSVRRLSAIFTRGKLTLDAGKQFIRWGKTDIVTPTDRFAPRDFLNVFDNELLAVTGGRGTVQAGSDTFDVVWVPRLTPSRVPLLNQRWTVLPPAAVGVTIVDVGAPLPEGSQTGLRWSHVGAGFEVSASFFDGFNHLPNFVTDVQTAPPLIRLARVYPGIRTYGGDAAIPLRWFTVKGEAAYFTSTTGSTASTTSTVSNGATANTDEYVLYVVQVERQSGEWVFVGGYAGEAVTKRVAALTFAPDRGLTHSIVARGSYMIDPNRNVAFETAVRENGAGVYAKGEYSQARGQHWRATIAGVLLAGEEDDFLGQYHRNSHVSVALRYSF